MMLDNCCRREPYVDTRPWYKKLWIYVSMRAKWNWPVTRHIYSWWSRRYSKQFASFVMPVIKNMPQYPTLPDLVQVQPMNVPSGLVFYMDFVRAEKRPWYQFWKRKKDIKS